MVKLVDKQMSEAGGKYRSGFERSVVTPPGRAKGIADACRCEEREPHMA